MHRDSNLWIRAPLLQRAQCAFLAHPATKLLLRSPASTAALRISASLIDHAADHVYHSVAEFMPWCMGYIDEPHQSL